MENRRSVGLVMGVVVLVFLAFIVQKAIGPGWRGAGAYEAKRYAYPLNFRVTVTAYTASADETDDTPEIAACGPIRSVVRVLALSNDLWEYVRCGEIVKLNGVNYVAWDRMNRKYWRRVDILMDSKRRAFQHGIQKGIISLCSCYVHQVRQIPAQESN